MKFNHLFRFCPVCGSSDFHQQNVKSMRCRQCDFSFYVNPSAAVAAFIINEQNELLVTIRAKEPAKGTCDLPGGFVDDEESAEAALVRELKEELGLNVTEVGYLFSLPNQYLYSGWTLPTLDLFYLVKIGTDIVPTPADDVADCNFMPLDQLDPQQFGLNSIRNAVHLFVKTYKMDKK
jgi:NAD+ diphosphatase